MGMFKSYFIRKASEKILCGRRYECLENDSCLVATGGREDSGRAVDEWRHATPEKAVGPREPLWPGSASAAMTRDGLGWDVIGDPQQGV